MLSIEQCRELLGEDGVQYTDAQIEELKGSLYEIAELALEAYFLEKKSIPKSVESESEESLEKSYGA